MYIFHLRLLDKGPKTHNTLLLAIPHKFPAEAWPKVEFIIQIRARDLKFHLQIAVDKGIRSYSQVLSRTIKDSVPVLSEKTLKKVVQEAVTDDDRSKNVVVFGLADDASEDLDGKISGLFDDIEEKPGFEALRIGEQSKKTNRPVKIRLRNSETVHRILQKAKNLRKTATHKTVYI